MLFSTSCLVFLAIVSRAAAGVSPVDSVSYDNDRMCVERNAKPYHNRMKLHCNSPGYLKSPSRSEQYVTYSALECAQRCFATSPHCGSFSFDTSAPLGDVNCDLYGPKVINSDFVHNSSSPVLYSGSLCYHEHPISDHPVGNPNFEGQSAAGAWHTTGSGEGSQSRSAYLPAVYSYKSDPYEVTNFGSGIYQVLTTCPGMTYSLNFDHRQTAKIQGPGLRAEFEVFLNEQSILDSSYDFYSSGSSSTSPVGPYYFTSLTNSTILYFLAPAPYDFSFASSSSVTEIFGEFIDHVYVEAVYRGSLPPDTNVPNV